MNPNQLALQLYTVRNEIARDGFVPVIKQIAAAGYRAVELAGVPAGLTATELRRILSDHGLQIAGGHFPLPTGEKANQILDLAQTLGCRFLGSSTSRELFQTATGIRQQAEQFNRAAETCRARGITCVLHNHWWEFTPVEGRCAYEWLLDALAPTVHLQLDVYWAQTGGQNPADWIRRLGRRAPLLHIKDGPCVVGQPMTAVGKGRVDIPACLQAARDTAEWFIVELDECATDMLEAVRDSARFLLDLVSQPASR